MSSLCKKISRLSLCQIDYLIEGFRKWYAKNNSEIDESRLLSVAQDMFEAEDTQVFSLMENNRIVGVFYIVDLGESVEVGGGMIGSSQSINNVYFVLDYCRCFALRNDKNEILLRVLKKHYKFEVLLRLYSRYGFCICSVDDESVFLSIGLACQNGV
jgi:hypothetical protein